ncbi:MAG TPA: hypothetical protein GXX75_11835 [Clostridiales bacterium]|nr:hypothetical protein [Clostridiales bacterium]
MCNRYGQEKLVSIKILIDSYEKINIYLNIVSLIENDVFMVSGDSCIDGKSLMSIFRLDILKPVVVHNIPLSFAERLKDLAAPS